MFRSVAVGIIIRALLCNESRTRVRTQRKSLGRDRLKTLALRLLNETEGQDLIEYALLAALIALAATLGMTALATGINNKFTAISSTLAS